MPTRTIRYRRPRLYPAQEAAIFAPERWAIVEASTKAGKTVGCIAWLVEQAALEGRPGRNYWWIAPIIPQARIAFERTQRYIPDAFIADTNKTDRTVTLANGATVWFKGSHDPDSLYGEDVYAAVVDEASRCKEAAWVAVRSTLTATAGPARIIGNVKGRKNWAYRLARRAEQGSLPDAHYAKLTAYDAVRGGVFSREEIEDARRMLPEAAFDELYLAIPGDDGSNPFGRQAIADCTAPVVAGPARAFGVDLARKRDWTVITGLTAERRTCQLIRFQVQWSEQVRRIRAAVGLTPTLVDETGIGDPVIDRIREGGGVNVDGYTFAPRSRQQLLEDLAVRVTGRDITFPQETADELDEFEYQVTPSGVVKYAAPEEFHDDRVMSLALANRHVTVGANVTAFEWM